MKPVHQLDLTGLHVLDGGMATELERKGFDLSGPLWSAHVLESSPEAIAAVHREYLEAGADCLLTASYQVSAEGFQQIGYDAKSAAEAAACASRFRGHRRKSPERLPGQLIAQDLDRCFARTLWRDAARRIGVSRQLRLLFR